MNDERAETDDFLYKVIGPKGAKRIAKTKETDMEPSQGGARGGHGRQRGRPPTRGFRGYRGARGFGTARGFGAARGFGTNRAKNHQTPEGSNNVGRGGQKRAYERGGATGYSPPNRSMRSNQDWQNRY